MFRQPAVSRTHVAFVHDGQIWVVPRGGGAAKRVTDSPGNKFDPRFSPDGQRIAFSFNDTSNSLNLYTVPIGGGATTQVTWLPSHPVLCQWTKDDRLLFYTNALSFSRIEMQLYTVTPSGGLPAKLPLTYGADGALDDSGRWLAYTPQWPNPLIRRWKRYRGGAAPDLSLVDLRTSQSAAITEWAGPDLRPMWHGGTIYYLSDAGPEGRINLWAFDTVTRARRQVTRFADLDVRSPSIGPGAIVFQQGADLQVLDLAKGTTSKLRVSLPRPASLARDVDAARFITNRQLAGGNLLFEARGDLWIAPIGGAARNLTATSGVFEREAALSPDGRRIAYMSDAGGEYQLYVRDVDGPAAAVPLTNAADGFRFRPIWSPDGRRLAFADHTGAIFVCDVDARRIARVDAEPWAEPPELAWSADSAWLVYTKTTDDRLSTLWRYDVATGARRQLTGEAFYAGTPVAARGGERMFFLSYRNFTTPVVDWISQRIAHRATAVIMAVAPNSDAERDAVRLATTPGSVTALGATHDGDAVFGLTDGAGKSSVRRYRMREKKEEVLIEGSSDFTLSFDGRQLLFTRDGQSILKDLGDGSERKLEPTPMGVRVDLRAEWRQVFDDVWRTYRDFFHAPKVAGAFDWLEVRKKYAPLVEHCTTREDVNDVIAEMIGEVGVGHAYIGSTGDVPPPPPANATGMLGADFELVDGVYRIARIYEGAPWDDTVRSPLRGVREGESLLAVNGVPLDPTKDPRAALAGLADKPVTLTIGPERRDVVVTPLVSEIELRYRDWVERNRAFVDKATGGRVGYVHVPEFTTSGYGEFVRQFSGQIGKEALIIDARWSLGGWVGGILAELLDRTPLNYAASRFSTNAWPAQRWGAHFGRKALLVNHITVSAGENFAFYFRKLGLGPIIGTRTWGGLTGLNPVPALIDGGSVHIPNAPFFDDSGWLIEGHGLEPDEVVPYDPARSGDPQLDAAIRAVMKK